MWLECITTQCGRLWGQCFSCVTLRHPEQEIMLKNSSRWDHQNSYASPCQKTTRNSWPIRHMNNTAEKSVFDSSKHKKVRIWEKKEYVHYSHLGSRGKTLMSECGQRCTHPVYLELTPQNGHCLAPDALSSWRVCGDSVTFSYSCMSSSQLKGFFFLKALNINSK